MLRSAWVEIDKPQLIRNIRAVQAHVGNSGIIGVVKGNAYGHGVEIVSRSYLECGVEVLGVATLDEAKELRDLGFQCSILMLGLVSDDLISEALNLGVIPLVSTYSCAEKASSVAVRKAMTVELMIAVDTGMGRIGFAPNVDSAKELVRISKLPNLRIRGLFTHFSSADIEDLGFTLLQKERFDFFYKLLEDYGIAPPIRTAANSPSILRLPEANYEEVRPGTIIWGSYPAVVTNHEELRVNPVMSVKCKVIYVKTVPKGTPISYGRKFVTQRESVIATLPMGYADGFTQTLLGKSRVLIHNQFAPTLGTLCMDQVMIDVTDIPNVTIGDEAVILGKQGDKQIKIEELVEASGVCSGELFYGFSCRLPTRVVT